MMGHAQGARTLMMPGRHMTKGFSVRKPMRLTNWQLAGSWLTSSMKFSTNGGCGRPLQLLRPPRLDHLAPAACRQRWAHWLSQAASAHAGGLCMRRHLAATPAITIDSKALRYLTEALACHHEDRVAARLGRSDPHDADWWGTKVA